MKLNILFYIGMAIHVLLLLIVLINVGLIVIGHSRRCQCFDVAGTCRYF